MGIFSVQPAYDRARVLSAASRARAERRLRKATALYRRVLAAEPDNLELHARLAPLLAARGLDFDAWASFNRCAQAALRDGELERAAAVYREVARCLPHRVEAWEKLARIERKRGREEAALEILLEARQHFRGRRWRAEAIAVLRRRRSLEPNKLEQGARQTPRIGDLIAYGRLETHEAVTLEGLEPPVDRTATDLTLPV